MKTVNSISGGKTSAYLEEKFPADYRVFSLVRIEDKDCLFPDKKLRQEVEDRIQKPFIATAEDDTIIYTMFDLEQRWGRKIDWVSGITFDEVIRTKSGWLPNKLHRYCTTWLKIDPIFYWWAETIGEICYKGIGYRSNPKEIRRMTRMKSKLSENGCLVYKATFEKNQRGQNKWEQIEWVKPIFPLIDHGVYKDEIHEFWLDKKVRFANLNNCVHCFHRNPMLLNKMSKIHPQKMAWAASQEGGKNGFWRNDTTYQKIIEFNTQHELSFDDFSECDSGFCGL